MAGGRQLVTGPIPWRSILTSGPVWGTFAAQLCSNWGTYLVQSILPTYLNDIVGLDLYRNGFYTALPYVLLTVVTNFLISVFLFPRVWGNVVLKISTFGGWPMDLAISKGLIRTASMRRLSNGVGTLGPALFLVLAGLSGCDAPASLACFVASVGLTAFAWLGHLVSFFDFAPRCEI